MKSPHPYTPRGGMLYHGFLVAYLLAGAVVHGICTYFHWWDWRDEPR